MPYHQIIQIHQTFPSGPSQSSWTADVEHCEVVIYLVQMIGFLACGQLSIDANLMKLVFRSIALLSWILYHMLAWHEYTDHAHNQCRSASMSGPRALPIRIRAAAAGFLVRTPKTTHQRLTTYSCKKPIYIMLMKLWRQIRIRAERRASWCGRQRRSVKD